MLETIIDAILPNILEIIATIISLVVAYYVIPCITEDLIPFLKEKRLYANVKKFVQAAEKLAESGAIAKTDKKAMVIELLESNGVVVNETVNAFIESCVKELDKIDSVIIETITDSESESEAE